MPILLNVDHEHKQVDSVAMGPVTYADVEHHLQTERHFQGLPYKELIDGRCAEILLTPAEVREIVALLRSLGQGSRLGPTAVLVDGDVAYGIVRMIEILTEDVAEVRPFRDEAQARRWLESRRKSDLE